HRTAGLVTAVSPAPDTHWIDSSPAPCEGTQDEFVPQPEPATPCRAAPGFVSRDPLRLRPLQSPGISIAGTGARRHDRTCRTDRQPDADGRGGRQAVPEADQGIGI